MNKLFIGLLVLAAGAGIYFLFFSKNQSTTSQGLERKLIVGKWSSGHLGDNNSSVHWYAFDVDGQLVRSLGDSIKPDSLFYAWEKSDVLILKDLRTDTSGQKYAVVQLTGDSLRLQAADSTMLVLSRVR